MASIATPPMSRLLSVDDVTVVFGSGQMRPVRSASFEVATGRTMGLVGESGSGKSMLLRAIIGLVPAPGRVVSGSVEFGGRDLLALAPRELQRIRGKDVAMIFQDPMASLNPVLTVGDQLTEALRAKLGIGRLEAREKAVELFARVGIRPPETRLGAYPHQFSGGMAQRVMIAIAICASPSLLLADEPTTALDVSIQDQVLALLEDLRLERDMSMVIVSHDFGVVARACDDVAVMYGGHLLERGRTEDVLRRPRHPYTRMLLATVPSLKPNVDRKPLTTIAGQLPSLSELVTGCPFAARCPHVRPACAELDVKLDAPPKQHASSCPFV